MLPIVLVVLVGLVVYEVRETRKRGAHPELSDASGGGGIRVALALSRVEGIRFLQHPAFAIGIVLTGLGAFVLSDWGPVFFAVDSPGIALTMFPLCGMTVIGISLATSRARRLGTDELFDTLPASGDARTTGHLLSIWWAMAAGSVALGLMLAAFFLRGAIGLPHPTEVATAVLLIACAGAVGVLSGRWVPSALSGPVAVIALAFFQGIVTSVAGPEELSPLRAFAPWHPNNDMIPDLINARRPEWHVLYLVGLGAIAAAVAMMRRRVDGRRLVALGLALAVTAAGGVAQARRIPGAELDRLAALVWNPIPQQHCEQRGTVRYCAFRGYESLIPQWDEAVQGVLAALPAAIRSRPLRVEQRIPGHALRGTPPEILTRLRGGAPRTEPFVWPDDGALHPGLSWCKPERAHLCRTEIAAAVAIWATGLPLSADQNTSPRLSEFEGYDPWLDPGEYGAEKFGGLLDTTGKAVGVVALYLVAQSAPRITQTFAKRFHAGNDTAARFQLTECAGGDPSALFHAREVAAAARLLRLPATGVRSTLHARWAEATDPSTTTETMLSWFTIDPASLPDSGWFETCA